MRILIAAAIAGIAAPAAAQTVGWIPDPMAQLRSENAAALKRMNDRQRALADERAAYAAAQRARTTATIQALESRRGADLAPAPFDAAMSAAAETIVRHQDEALAASNARILAIKPASEE